MKRPVSCTECETILDESSDLPAEQRSPCPKCGSLKRTVHVFDTDMFQMTDSASAVISLPPGLLLQATVLLLGHKVSEGRLIESVGPAWFEIAELMEREPSIIYQIDARKWEEIIAGAYERAGFDEVILTPRSNDYGRDVIAIKRGFVSVRIIDQVKAYGPNHLVTADDVRALVGVLVTDQNATKGIVTTTSEFAPGIARDPFIQPHVPYRLELINGKTLIGRLNDLAKEKRPS